MINLKELHTDDLSMNSGKLFREQMAENFKAIEQEDKNDDQALSDEVTDRKKGDDAEKAARQSTDDDLEKRIKKLEDNSATHDEVKQVSQEWNNRASHIARGTDIETTKAVVEQILQEKGLI